MNIAASFTYIALPVLTSQGQVLQHKKECCKKYKKKGKYCKKCPKLKGLKS